MNLPRCLRSRIVLGIAAALAAVACASIVPVQRWDDGLGPVIPHDSFPADCTLCHLSGSWNELRPDFAFDHEAETGVPLLGAHATASCLRCHNDRGPVATFAARGCAGCHLDVHRGNLGQDCSSCHDERNWRPNEVIAQHDRTRFPLVGAHVGVACFRCHAGAQVGNFAGADPTCVACHGADLARAIAPDHLANGWTDDCQRCHTPFDWRPARFDHPPTFPLSQGHGGLGCTACHSGSSFAGLSTDCATCHSDDFMTALEPQHAAAGFSTQCDECHAPRGWQPAAWSHPPTFALAGAHAMPRCSGCHGGGIYAGLPSACIDCHAAEFGATTSPNHAASGFSTDCTQCHGTVAWRGAGFAHTAAFPLTGAHTGLDCARCHVGNVFAGLPSACIDCHDADYRAAANPNHVASGFPTDCTQCHNTTTWSGATFAHLFPLTGDHRLGCAECHLVPSAPQQFSCTHCHAHSQSEMADEHDEVAGYVWSSPSCLSCHPTGR